MIQVSHDIQIFSKAEAFFEFYNTYDKHFIDLAPENHIRFRFLTQPPVQVGTTTLSEEVLFGKDQKVRHKIVELTAERVVLKGLFPLSLIGGRLIFKLEKHQNYFVLFEILEFGFKSFFGKLSDPVLRMYLKGKYPELNNHSGETLQNIKRIIEKPQQITTTRDQGIPHPAQ